MADILIDNNFLIDLRLEERNGEIIENNINIERLAVLRFFETCKLRLIMIPTLIYEYGRYDNLLSIILNQKASFISKSPAGNASGSVQAIHALQIKYFNDILFQIEDFLQISIDQMDQGQIINKICANKKVSSKRISNEILEIYKASGAELDFSKDAYPTKVVHSNGLLSLFISYFTKPTNDASFLKKIDSPDDGDITSIVNYLNKSAWIDVDNYTHEVAMFLYIISAIFIRIKGDNNFPAKLLKKSGTSKRDGLLKDFSYIYHSIGYQRSTGQKISFLSNDKGLLFRFSIVSFVIDKNTIPIRITPDKIIESSRQNYHSDD